MSFYSFFITHWYFWLLGLVVLFTVYKSPYRNFIRIDIPTVVKFAKFLICLNIYRIKMLMLFPHVVNLNQYAGMLMIPWQATLFVYWEDACHGLQLALFKHIFVKGKISKLIYNTLFCTVFIAFGLGHLYQGIFAAMFISLYTPMAIDIGTRRGFGTVMLNHIMFDLSQLLFLKYMLGI